MEEKETLYQLVERLKPLHIMLNENTYIHDTTQRLQLLMNDAQEKPIAAFIGKERVGKTSIINAVLGRQLLSTNTMHPTSIHTFIKYGQEEFVKAYFSDGMIVTFTMDKIHLLTTEDTFISQIIREHLDYIEVYVKHELLQHISLVDSVALQVGANNSAYVSTILLERVQQVFWVLKDGSSATEEEINLLKKLTRNHAKPYFVINAKDAATRPTSLFIEKEKAVYGDLCQDMLAISARQALEAKKTNDTQAFIDSNITRLTELLKEVGKDEKTHATQIGERLYKWLKQLHFELQVIPEREPYVTAMSSVRKYAEEKETASSIEQRDSALLQAFEEEYKSVSQCLRHVETLYQLLQVLATELYLRDAKVEMFEEQALIYQEAVREYRKCHADYMQKYEQANLQFEKTYDLSIQQAIDTKVELTDYFGEHLKQLNNLQEKCSNVYEHIKNKEQVIFDQLYSVQNHITALCEKKLQNIMQQVFDVQRQQRKDLLMIQSYSDKLQEFSCISEAQKFIHNALYPFLEGHKILPEAEQQQMLQVMGHIAEVELPHEEMQDNMPQIEEQQSVQAIHFDRQYALYPLHLTEADVVSAELPKLPEKLNV